MKSSTSKLSRRHFLFTLGAGGIATTAVVAGKSRAPQKKASAAAGGRGYQLTEHVRKYYDTTKV